MFAIVSGSAMNIGRQTSLKLAECGAAVITHARENEAGAKETAAMITSRGGNAVTYVGDLSEPRHALAPVDTALQHCGGFAGALMMAIALAPAIGVRMILGPFLLGAGIAGEALVATVAVQGVLLKVIKTATFGLSPFLTYELMLIGAVYFLSKSSS